jgi:hypothetical protein
MSKAKLLLSSIAISVLLSSPSNALTFPFSFTNDVGTTAGTVNGEIDGLLDDATSSATHVIVYSSTGTTNLGLPAPFDAVTDATLIPQNTFTVAGGIITSFAFNGQSGDWYLCFGLCSPPAFLQTLIAGPHVDDLIADSRGVSFSAVADTPLPAALPLFASGLGALGLLGWRRKRKGAAALAA